ncbi:unnamed protein product, partial [Rotaria sp. Silwood2]
MYAYTFDNDYNQNQCVNICSLNINEIDILKFISGTYEERKEIALLFDKTFQEFESVANYKGQKKASTSDSIEAFFYSLSNLHQNNSIFTIDKLPELFRHVIPEYILKARQLVSYVHSIADMALELDENTFEQNNTSNNASFTLRLTKYLPTKNEEQLAFGEHQDYLGFTLIQNDNVPGLEVNINERWFRVESKPNTLLLVGGEFIERWTNNYWKAILHRVAAVKQLRYSVLFFSGPDMNCVIQTLP